METAQRKLYDELRQHYRESLLKRIETDGLTKSKIQVLEALLRLRQAACHPALLDPKRMGDPSAKLEALLARLREVVDEGHKALVFSQFTSLLKIVRERLNESGIVYEYLDGATRDRQARIERFQTDPSCRIFLISLKAGGVAEPYRRGVCIHPRSLVEPGRGSAGGGSHAPHRTTASGLRVSADRP